MFKSQFLNLFIECIYKPTTSCIRQVKVQLIICCFYIFDYRVDVTDREKVLETSKKVIKEVGTVSILVQNAGIMPQHEILKHSEEEIKKIYEINSIAHHWMMQAFLVIKQNMNHLRNLFIMCSIVARYG